MGGIQFITYNTSDLTAVVFGISEVKMFQLYFQF